MPSWFHLRRGLPRIAAQREGSVLLQTARFGAEDTRSYLFTQPAAILAVRKLDELPQLFRRMEAALQAGYFAAGFLSYECGYHFEPASFVSAHSGPALHELPLAWFGIFSEPLIFNHREGTFTGKPPLLPQQTHHESSSRDLPLVLPQLQLSPFRYKAKVEAIKRLIEAGDSYQVNLTSRLELNSSLGPGELFQALMQSQPVSYGALLNLGETHILSASPELFFRISNRKITTRPMKGTAARGKDIHEDAVIANWLGQDEKNRSENVMIVDLLRNDLGRICRMGSVRTAGLFSIEKYPSLFQMTSAIHGELLPGLSYYEIFRSLFPSGSVVGAPKIRTMQIIRELEAAPRGVYTGSIGFISPHGEAAFNVAIRTLVLRHGRAEMGVGSGIVYDSDPAAEYEECRLKASFLTQRWEEFQLIETMLWQREYFLLPLHLERLAASADYFGFVFDRGAAGQMLAEQVKTLNPECSYKVRLLLGASGALSTSSVPLAHAEPMVALRMASQRTCSADVFLRHKTTRRGCYDRQHAEAVALGFSDALFCNERGEVTEAAVHNIFIETQGKLLTPPLSAGVLPGVYRRHVLQSRPGVEECPISLHQLFSADRVFVCNAVRGWREVTHIERRPD